MADFVSAGGAQPRSFVEGYTLDASGRIDIKGRIVGGTSQLAGSTGSVEFTGIDVGAVSSAGRYDGQSRLP